MTEATDTGTRSGFRGLWSRSRRPSTIGALAMALLVGFASWYLGVDPVHAIIAGLVTLAVGITVVAVPYSDEAAWVARGSAGAGGSRRDVTRLSLSLTPSFGRVRHSAYERVHALARHRLALHHLDLDNPQHAAAIQGLIGPAAYATVGPGKRSPRDARRGRREYRRPPLRAVIHCLDMLDRIDPAAPQLTGPATP